MVSYNWPKDSIIDVDVMQLDEARDLVKEVTRTTEKDSILSELVEKRLGLLPLAIRQACGYMVANKSMSVAKYLDLYDDFIKEFLAIDNMPSEEAHLSVKVNWDMNTIETELAGLDKNEKPSQVRLPVAVTWKMNIKKI